MDNNFLKIFDTYVLQKDPISKNVDLKKCCKHIQTLKKLRKFFNSIDAIYIGVFQELKDKNVEAAYTDGCIYVSSDLIDDNDFITSVVHEVSHVAEQDYMNVIYADSALEREFLEKREILSYDLENNNFKVPHNFTKATTYDKSIDDFLYADVGYEQLDMISNGVFPTPYSCTTVREYWAICFEMFFNGQIQKLKNMCPTVYKKIVEVLED